jgi:dTDP-4-dehydrorhamnose reductase
LKKLLLTGASGFLGWNLCNAATRIWQVHGIINSADFNFSGVTVHRQSLRDAAAIRKLFNEIKPDAVIHTAAISDPNYCQQHPQETYPVNVTATQILAELSAEKKVPFVFTSTDLVFDGKKGNYKETDAVNPISAYGEQKVEAEKKVREVYPETAICRMPIMLGTAGASKKGYLYNFLSAAGKGESSKLFVDEFRTPLGGVSAAEGLLHAVQHFKGTYHLGGKERISRFQLGEKIAQAFSIPITQLTPLKQAEVKMAAPRPPDVSFDSRKSFQAGFAPQLLLAELQALSAAGYGK